jgi:RHS repeat-associated protein
MKTTLIRQRTGRLRKGVFTHNDRSELTAATMGDKAFAYDYDNIGNRKTAQEEANDFTYTANALNQYTEITENEVPFTPTFDADGNQTRIKTTTGIWEAVYNAFNRPLTFTRENADGTLTVISADYDYMGRRVFKKVETVATDSETGEETHTVVSNHRFLYRGYLQIAALDLTRTTLNELWFITWDPTEPVATRPLAIQQSGTWYTYGLDLPKNITEVYGTDGYIKTAYTYSPYGLVTSTGSTVQPIQWSSEYHDTDLALIYYNYRQYNPLDGRWTGRDPIFLENLYEYCSNITLNSFDLFGLKKCHKKVILTYYGDLSSDKVGTRNNKLKDGDIAVGHYGSKQFPKKSDKWVLPFGTKATVHVYGAGSFSATVADVGAYDKKHPDKAGPEDWIDIWNPEKSRKAQTDSGCIEIEVQDSEKCLNKYKEGPCFKKQKVTCDTLKREGNK